MVNSIPIMLLASTVTGFLAGIGVGGGSLLMLWMTLIAGIPQPQARVLNLIFFLPSAIISTLFRWRQGTLDFKKVLPSIIGGCISAAIFAWLSTQIDVQMLKKLFGILLLGTGLRELLYRPRKKKIQDN